MEVFDIVGAGPRGRYMVRGGPANPPMVVHNCGYSLGHAKFVDYAKLTAGITLTTDESKLYVDGYRHNNDAVVKAWRQGELVLAALVRGEQGYFGGPDGRLFFYDGSRHVLGEHIPGIRLPDGCWISYPKLEAVEGKYGPTYRFTEMQGRKREVIYLYGGKLIQNVVQAFAFGVMKYYSTMINYKIVLNSHDEHVLCVPTNEADAAAQELETLMKTAPPWAPGLPLDCEVHVGRTYGELK